MGFVQEHNKFSKNRTNRINLAKIMTKFFNKFKKLSFWPIFGSYPQYWGQKKFFQKIRLCHVQLHMGFQHHAKV